MARFKNSIDTLCEKYDRVLNNSRAPRFLNDNIKKVTAQVLENSYNEAGSAKLLTEATNTGDIAQYTPVLISLIRRVVPTLVGNELVGVQPLTQPTGRIFCQRIFYGENRAGGVETWESGPPATGSSPGAAPDPSWGGAAAGTGMSTAVGEALGKYDTDPTSPYNLYNPNPWAEVSFGIDFIDVKCDTRALKGKVTTEVIQDLKSVHGLDAESELASILQTEMVAEIDREILMRIRQNAKVGALNTATPGIFDFDVDADGRWVMEKVQGLLLQIEEESTRIALETRRGRGNFIITSPQLAAYLSMANLITNIYGNTGFVDQINPVGISYYGQLCNRYGVYVDPYLVSTPFTDASPARTGLLHEVIVGLKGSEIDAGLFYCPYSLSLFLRATDPEQFSSILGVKSRYAFAQNPYFTSTTDHTNSYYRSFTAKI